MSPSPQDVQATFAATLVDEWVRGGVDQAVLCPGSRSTPLALALVDHPGIIVHVHQDERSAGFLALGLALASGRPAVVLTTSGTAAVELHPAVTEADHAAVAMLVCTADRPPELRDVGAPQTIDQTHLYGRSVRWFADPGVADEAGAPRWRAFAARAVAAATGRHPGPVQLNLPFREPLVGTAGPLPPARGDGPWTRVRSAAGPRTAGLPDGLAGRRGLILAGHPAGDGDVVLRLAEDLGWPVAADPRSSAWRPHPHQVLHLDAILRSDRARTVLQPEVILRVGAPPASRVVNEWCAASGAEEIVVPGPAWSDPAATAAVVLSELGGGPAGSQDRIPGWLERWTGASSVAQRAVTTALADAPGPTEAGVARDVVAGLPAGARLVVSSSMPIRDVERYAEPRSDLRVLANRGANGIDGVVSTAVGVALDGGPTGLLIGDLAFLHDSNGLLGLARRGVDLVCVVVDNDGGGIFSFLPQAGRLPEDRFELLFGTPHGMDLVALATAYGVPAGEVHGAGEVAKAVAACADEGGPHVLVVRTGRAANVEAHRLIDEAVASAVAQAMTAFEG